MYNMHFTKKKVYIHSILIYQMPQLSYICMGRLWGPPSLLSNGYRGSFIGGKAAGAWSWPLTSIQFRGQRMRGAIPLLPQYAFMAWCSVKKSRGI